jgi:hypothetical protein
MTIEKMLQDLHALSLQVNNPKQPAPKAKKKH